MTLRRESPPAVASMGDLTKRVLATAVMIPLALAAIWASPFTLAVLCWVGAAVVFAEWTGLTGQPGRTFLTLAGAAVLALCAGLLLQDQHGWAIAVLAAGAVAMFVLPQREGAPHWRAAGLLYAGMPLLAMVLLRLDVRFGVEAILWLMLVVWSTDTCAYFAGKGIGGPKLWPAVSPKKTWAGLIGGVLGAMAVGTLMARWLGEPLLPLAAFSGLTALVAQAGDFAESALKRHFNAKDSGNLIPGHGGLMDRVDGLVAAAVFVILVGTVRAGAEAPATGLLFW